MLYFIVNQTSRTGRGAQVWEKVQEVLKEKNRKVDKEEKKRNYQN